MTLLWAISLAFAADTDATGPCVDMGTWYDDVTAESGIRGFVRGLGANLNDFDNDGDIDIFLATGPATVDGAAYYPGNDLLYVNDGELHFDQGAGPAGLADLCEDRAPLFGDLDNDGLPDLYVTVNGHNMLYHNLGNGRFRDVSDFSGAAADPGWGHQGFLLDYDRDGFLDVFFTNGPEDGSGFNSLLHNERDGTLRDVSWQSGVAGDPSGKGTCVLDVNQDDWPDIFVTTGREFGNHLFINQQNGKFADEAYERGLADPTQRFGVGATCGDLDNDGDEDILLVTHDRVWGGNQLWENRDGFFVDVADVAGIGPFKDGHGQALVDLDLDGRLDIVLSGIRTPPYVFHNEGDLSFRRVCNGAGITQEDGLTWSVTAGDMTFDGYPEIFISNGLGRRPRDAALFRHRPGDGHFLTIEAVGTQGNASALGARVEVDVDGQTLYRRVGTWSSFDSQGPLPVTVGLGDATVADAVRVVFPSGAHVDLANVQADQAILVEEPGGLADTDHDGVQDDWDLCPGSRLAFRTDGDGCSVDQRGSFDLTLVAPLADIVVADVPTFTWSGEMTRSVLQISLDGTFGPAGRLDFGPLEQQEYRLPEAAWRDIVSESDGTRPVLWRIAAIDAKGREAFSAPQRLYVAKPTDLVTIPRGANIFSPAHIVVTAGTTVTWWNDAVSAGNLQNEPHQVQLMDPFGRPVSEMRDLNGSGFFTYTMTIPGVYSYVCHKHSGDGTPGNTVSENHLHLQPRGPYRCMAGTVTVR